MTELKKTTYLKIDKNNQLQKNNTYYFIFQLKQFFQEVRFEMLGF